MIREIVKSGDSVLRKKSKKVQKLDKKTLSLIKDLKDTLDAQTDPEGVGLAAPQIGKNVRVFVMKPEEKLEVIINPEVISAWKDPKKAKKNVRAKKSKKNKKIMEGCLSLPNYYTPLVRNYGVKIKFMNEAGITKEKIFEGIEAQIVQHEIDHLNGTLFIDRLLEQKKKLYEYTDGEWEEIEL
jgi:peptide deformylase